MFAEQWRVRTGEVVVFEESYRGAGTQVQALMHGEEADVAALSIQQDMDRLVEARILSSNWNKGPRVSMVSFSTIALGVKKGNPKNIRDWDDLARPGVRVLFPSPSTSGLGRWSLMAMYGAALRGRIQGVEPNDTSQARDFVRRVKANHVLVAEDAMQSFSEFATNSADVLISYEQLLVGKEQEGYEHEIVVPTSTILVENPVAVLDQHVDHRDTREVSEAFVSFLFTPEAQQVFADNGFRTFDPKIVSPLKLPEIKDLFTVRDLGGWKSAELGLTGGQGWD